MQCLLVFCKQHNHNINLQKTNKHNVLMNSNSCVPQSWKRNLVKNLYCRNKHVVSRSTKQTSRIRRSGKNLKNSWWKTIPQTTLEQIQKRNNLNSNIVKNTEDNNNYFTIQYIRKISKKFSKNTKTMFEDIGVKIALRIVHKK